MSTLPVDKSPDKYLADALREARTVIQDMHDSMAAIRGSATYPVKHYPGMINVRMGKQEFEHFGELGVAATAAVEKITAAFRHRFDLLTRQSTGGAGK